jgi:hypothetical protein
MTRYYKIISVVCIFALASIVIWVKRTGSVEQELVCTDIVSGCGNDLFKLKFLNSPQVMKPIRLELETANARQVYASFAMERMEMGLNRYHLLKQADSDFWFAEVTLPVCVQGRSDWVVELEIKTQLQTMHYQIPFKVDAKN